MKKATLIVSVITSIAMAQPSLWIQAKSQCENQSSYAKQLIIDEVITTRSGSVVEQSSVTIGQDIENQESRFSFISATENGRAVKRGSDIRELTEAFAESSTEDIYGEEINPLLGNVSNIEEGASSSTDDQTIQFDYVQETSDGTWEGTLYIDEESGEPVQIEAQFANVPFTEDGVTINSLSLNGKFISVDDNAPVISSVVYRSEIAVKEGILPTFHGVVNNSIDFKSYQSIVQ